MALTGCLLYGTKYKICIYNFCFTLGQFYCWKNKTKQNKKQKTTRIANATNLSRCSFIITQACAVRSEDSEYEIVCVSGLTWLCACVQLLSTSGKYILRVPFLFYKHLKKLQVSVTSHVPQVKVLVTVLQINIKKPKRVWSLCKTLL